LLNEFEIAETENFQKLIGQIAFRHINSKIRNYVYPQLRKNPFFGPNIKKLKGDFSDLYRYRIGNFWLFYTIDSKNVLAIITGISDRKDAY